VILLDFEFLLFLTQPIKRCRREFCNVGVMIALSRLTSEVLMTEWYETLTKGYLEGRQRFANIRGPDDRVRVV
jgi:hypothetical protein